MTSQPLKVLVVAEDRRVLRQLSKLLTTLSYEVRQVADRQQAMASLDAESPDFLIIDASSAAHAALETCRAACAPDRARYIYTLLLVDEPALGDLTDALATGVDDFLAKPIVHGELLARLRAGARTIEFERRFREQAGVDALTGLPNRVALRERLGELLTSNGSRAVSVACVVADLDFFAQVNHGHGRPAGDAALKGVAARLRESCDEGTLLACFGGGRFGALLPHASQADAAAWAERLRKSLAEGTIDLGGQPLRLTASLGFAVAGPGATPDEVLDQACEALSAAKNSGRDCVVHFGQFDADAASWAELAGPGKLFERTVARDVMTPCTVTVSSEEPLEQVAQWFRQTRLPALPVTDADGTLCGIVLDESMPKQSALGRPGCRRLSDVMTADAPVYEEDTQFSTLVDFFTRDPRSVVVIARHGKPTGLVTRDSVAALGSSLSLETFAATGPYSSGSLYLLVPDLRPLGA